MIRLGLVAVLVAVTAAGCAPDQEDSQDAAPVALVSLATAKRGALRPEATLYGIAEPSAAARVSLATPVEGTLAQIVAPPGTPIRVGQIVARLSPSPTTRLDLAKAASDAGVADLALARARRLRADGLASDADVQTAAAAARTAGLTRASLSALSEGLMIRATAAGVVDAITPALGDLVPAGGPVATISRSGDPRARFGIDPNLAASVHAGSTLRIAATESHTAFTGPVESVAPVIDPQTRLISLFARLPAESGVRPGQTLSATVTMSAGPNDAGSAITVPYAALLDDGGQSYVFVAAGGVVHRRDVTPGATLGDRVVIARGVAVGDRVVVAGGTAVEDGMKVRTR